MKKRGEFLDGAVDAVASKELEAGVKHGDGAGDALGSAMKAGEPAALASVLLFDLESFCF